MAEDRPYLLYPFRSPRMDQSVPPTQVPPGSLSRVAGVDGRFNGSLRKYYGNRLVVDLKNVTGMEAIATHAGPDYVAQVTFQKRGKSDIFRGFVVRWDSLGDTSNEQVDFVYTVDNGDTWGVVAIWTTGNGISTGLAMDCVAEGEFLMVAVDTKETRTVYWDEEEEKLAVVAAGPGAFSATPGPMTRVSSAVDADYNLSGTGIYQVAWRFYDSRRGVYSALSEPVTVALDHRKRTFATGTVSFNPYGYSNGLFVDGDYISINGRTYVADSGGGYTGTVPVNIVGLTTIDQHVQALVNAINGDDSAEVTATAQVNSALLTAKVRGSGGNSITLVKVETGVGQDDLSVSGATLSGGGFDTDTPEDLCRAVLSLPADTAVLAEHDYDDFAAMFDTIDVFRTIDIGDVGVGAGAIFYLEQSIPKEDNWDSAEDWNSLQVTIGKFMDTALPFATQYDPGTDVVTTPPQSGAIARYEGQTYMAQAVDVKGGYDTVFSSAEHVSPEYFTTYNIRKGMPEDGRPMRFVATGESLFQLSKNAVVHVYKSGELKPIRFSRLHVKRGLVGRGAAHAAGNSVFMVSGLGLVILNATDGSMGAVSAVNRVMFDSWKEHLANIRSGYDSPLNASFFLCPELSQMLVVWHNTQLCTMFDGANFVEITEGPDIATGGDTRVGFVTRTGRIVRPDNLCDGSGTMWDVDGECTLNGTVTSVGEGMLTDKDATFTGGAVGALVYMTSGANAGECREITSAEGTTLKFEPFPNPIAVGDRYAVSPVPVSVRAWAMQVEEISRFTRWVTGGVAVKARSLEGFTANPNAWWRVGAYCNGRDTLDAATAYVPVDEDPHNSAEAFNVHGVDVEPYIEQISSGTMFELTDVEFALRLSDSRKDSAD